MSKEDFGPMRLCFCDVPLKRLEAFARSRYIDGLGTLELLKTVEGAAEKEWVCLVGLLDVSPAVLAEILGDDPDRLLHVLSCRGKALDWLELQNISIRVKKV